MERPQLTADDINFAIFRVHNKTRERLNEKGHGILISRHEMLGVITEEYNEFIEAVESGGPEHLEDELLDIAVACIISSASLQTGETDW